TISLIKKFSKNNFPNELLENSQSKNVIKVLLVKKFSKIIFLNELLENSQSKNALNDPL
ncbi:hypothetical protein GLOIN_2v1716762, partial [Rhizophagus irregularis DAOM 181602=DAOM 197198]